jgi:PPOX class probable FMN-dependent enzyme
VATHWDDTEVLTTESELRELFGEPAQAARDKVRTTLDELDRIWLAHSPYCLIGTSAADGSCDVSPKGDPPGFVMPLDDATIAIPERQGNRRIDGFRNLLSNPRVGLLSLIPGRNDSLRINGRAIFVREAPFFDRMVVRGHRPALALVVEIEELFYHCGKSAIRSRVWKPETWAPGEVPSRARIAQALERKDWALEDLEEYYGPKYEEGVYDLKLG